MSNYMAIDHESFDGRTATLSHILYIQALQELYQIKGGSPYKRYDREAYKVPLPIVLYLQSKKMCILKVNRENPLETPCWFITKLGILWLRLHGVTEIMPSSRELTVFIGNSKTPLYLSLP